MRVFYTGRQSLKRISLVLYVRYVMGVHLLHS